MCVGGMGSSVTVGGRSVVTEFTVAETVEGATVATLVMTAELVLIDAVLSLVTATKNICNVKTTVIDQVISIKLIDRLND